MGLFLKHIVKHPGGDWQLVWHCVARRRLLICTGEWRVMRQRRASSRT